MGDGIPYPGRDSGDRGRYRVRLTQDPETGHIVAELPAVGITDYGKDALDALARFSEMLRFHLDCLHEESKAIPQEESTEEGLYLRVRPPIYAA